jgi:RNA polymerase sigma-54 factor
MRLDTSQQMRLEQRMKLAPRMIQAMEILQLPLMALQERIDAELASNPVLEMREDADEAPLESDAPETTEDRALVVRDNNNQAEDFQRAESFQHENETEVWEGEDFRPVSLGAGERDAKMDAMSNTPAPPQSLYEYLIDQWAFVEAPAAVRQAGGFILVELDEDGYLRQDLEDLAARSGGKIALEDLEAALPLVQQLEPFGVGARDLKECLLIQLAAQEAAGEDVGLEQELIRSFTRDIQSNRLPHIARKTAHTVDEIKAAIEHLSHLNPRPGSLIGERSAPTIAPDLVVELDEAGEPVVRLAGDTLPPLHINRAYRRMARNRELDKGARQFLQENIRSAQWLIGAISQRRATMLRVAQEVFAAQKDFFALGQAGLRALPMALVAKKVGVHVATISRAVAGKYAQTPRGIFPLRMFFSGGTTNEAGEDMAWDAIRDKLREIIDSEDKAKPLNDDELVEALTQAGITIARRTVAKYRGILKIPPARQRRQY